MLPDKPPGGLKEEAPQDFSGDPVLRKEGRDDEAVGGGGPLSSDGSFCPEVFLLPLPRGHHLSVYQSLNVTSTSAKLSHGLDGILSP